MRCWWMAKSKTKTLVGGGWGGTSFEVLILQRLSKFVSVTLSSQLFSGVTINTMHLVMAWFFSLIFFLKKKIVHLMSKLVQQNSAFCLGALSVCDICMNIVFETTCPGFVRRIIWLCIFFS